MLKVCEVKLQRMLDTLEVDETGAIVLPSAMDLGLISPKTAGSPSSASFGGFGSTAHTEVDDSMPGSPKPPPAPQWTPGVNNDPLPHAYNLRVEPKPVVGTNAKIDLSPRATSMGGMGSGGGYAKMRDLMDAAKNATDARDQEYGDSGSDDEQVVDRSSLKRAARRKANMFTMNIEREKRRILEEAEQDDAGVSRHTRGGKGCVCVWGDGMGFDVYMFCVVICVFRLLRLVTWCTVQYPDALILVCSNCFSSLTRAIFFIHSHFVPFLFRSLLPSSLVPRPSSLVPRPPSLDTQRPS